MWTSIRKDRKSITALVSLTGAATSPAWGTAALAFGGGALVGYGIKKGYDYYKEWQQERKREEDS